MSSRAVLLLLAAAATTRAAAPAPVRIDLGTLAGHDGMWSGARDHVAIAARGVDLHFVVPVEAARSPRPTLEVSISTAGRPGAPAPVRARVVDERSGRQLAVSQRTCWSGDRDAVCRLPIHLRAASGRYRVEVRASTPTVASVGVSAYDPLER